MVDPDFGFNGFEYTSFGFKGGMTAKKYMRIAQISKATATRDLQKLHQMGVFTIYGDGRNTSYQIQWKVN